MAIFSGTMMDDILLGTMDDDVLWGGMGDDELSGGAGNDRLIGGPGGDNLDGGPDMDTADYTGSMYPVHVDLRSPFSLQDDDPAPVHGGDAEGDMLTSIEHVWGSRGADTLIGNHVGNILAGNAGDDKIDGMGGRDYLYGEAGHDVLMGGSGHDVLSGGMGIDELVGGSGNDLLRGGDGDDALYGGVGKDVLEGGGGADVLDGGEGSDTAAYTMSDEAVTINLAHAQDLSPLTPGPSGGDAAGDDLMDIENLRGSMHDDKLTGDDNANKLYGNQGDDMLMGGMGNDAIRGDKGDDTLTGGDGKDTFWLMEGDGDDTIEDFESGDDTIRFGAVTQKLTASEIRDILDTEDESRDGFTYEWEDVSITVDRPLTAGDFGVKAASTSLDNGDNDWPDGQDSDGEDYFDTSTAALEAAKERAVDGDNVIHGLAGDDTIMGGDGDDTLYGNVGDDMLMGEDDDDILDGGPGHDVLMGGDDDDMLKGGSGNDTLVGGRHDDELSGGTGYDVFKFGERDGRDTIKGFTPGFDKIKLVDDDGNLATDAEIEELLEEVRENDDGYYTYSWKHTTFTVDEALEATDFYMEPEADPTIMLSSTQANWTGTADNEKVQGNDLDNMLDGGAGNDTLYGGMGDDMLDGGMGNDVLSGGLGNDTFQIDANAGMDTIKDFLVGDMIMLGDKAPTADEVNDVLKTQDQADGGYVYTWMNTEFTVMGTRPLMATDFEQADPPTKTLAPDRTTAWPDTAMGETNDDEDMVQGNALANTIKGGDMDDTLMGGAGNDVLEGEDDDDTLMGEAGDDTLMGGDGKDTLDGGFGKDTLNGGGSKDMLYADRDDLFDDQGNTDPADDTYDNVSGLLGGEGEDTLSFMKSSGSSGIGAAGSNTDTQANATDGAVTFTTATNMIEHLVGSPQADSLILESVAPSAPGVTPVVVGSENTLSGGAGNDTLAGGSGHDKVNGDAGDDMLFGDVGNDMLDGGTGNDTLTGAAGNDTLDGGAGRDTLTGQEGNDTFIWGNGDTITDFDDNGNDVLMIPGITVAQKTALIENMTTYDSNSDGTADGLRLVHNGEEMFLPNTTAAIFDAVDIMG